MLRATITLSDISNNQYFNSTQSIYSVLACLRSALQNRYSFPALNEDHCMVYVRPPR